MTRHFDRQDLPGLWHLGINLGHDRSAALVRDGEIVVAIQQERLDRIKHSVGILRQSPADPAAVQLPWEAIRYCLDRCGIDFSDLASIAANMPGSDFGPEILARSLPAAARAAIRPVPSHHLAHAYTAYWPSGFDAALVLVADASGSTGADRRTESYTLYQAQGDRLSVLHAEGVPAHLAALSTLGFIYEYITSKAGFCTPIGPDLAIPEAGKLMGLAPYGAEQPGWHPWIRAPKHGYSLEISAYDIFLEVAALEKRYDDGRGKPYLRPWLVDLAYKVQQELELGLLTLVERARSETGLSKLCLAGGVALNSVANCRLLQELGLADIFVFPAAGDAGIAAGCALWSYATGAREPRRRQLRSAALGRPYSAPEIARALAACEEQVEVEILSPDESLARTAAALARGQIVARFEGGSEFGPRALGQRSILADPTFERMRDILNVRVKFREPFRPFAPVIPQEECATVFEQEMPSPFMLLVAGIRPQYRAQIPAVTHCDGSGRIQTVTVADNPWLHALCQAVRAVRGGPPVLLNTSFNVAGQPIVETPQEAIATFLATDIDVLVLEDRWIVKRGQPIRGYAEHLARVTDGPMPHGLAPGQPPVTELMAQLDRALFGDMPEECLWSAEELRALSGIGARYKETSRLFPANPFGGPFRTQLSANAVLLLDPLGQCALVGLGAGATAWPCSLEEARLALALVEPSPARLGALRRERQASSREWALEVSKWIGRLRACALEPRSSVPPADPDSPLPQVPANRTLEPFATEDYRLDGVLDGLHQALARARYCEDAICAALEVESLQQIEATRLYYDARFRLPVGDDLADLIRLFLLHDALARERIAALLGEAQTAALIALAILVPTDALWRSRVDLYPVDGLYLATDRRYMLSETDRIDEDPVMYIGLDSLGLVCTAPRSAVDRALDLCTGSGVQALIASRYADEVVGIDINPRAIRFARFNAQLNGIRNARFLVGDLYAPVAGETFDRVLANPPFVPSPAQELGFRDGGTRGEDLLGRIVAGAPARLSATGSLYVVSDLADAGSYEMRLAAWWGPSPADRLILRTADRNEAQFSIPHVYRPFGQSPEEYARALDLWVGSFRAAGLGSVNFGYILIRRLPQGVAGSYYARVVHSPRRPIHEEVARYFDLQERLRQGASLRLRLRPHPAIRVECESAPGGEPLGYTLAARDNPYFTRYPVAPPIVELLRSIAREAPTLRDFLGSSQESAVLDLLRKGILQLGEGRASGQSAPSWGRGIDRPPAGAAPPASGAESIRELESKTTPTCLSSYLRR